ncbi:PH domain-containing protein [Pontibacillus salipaludis]|uniref:PH domain-containing protein n=1 Tax=Pontibacillus salipaludis TaxID=1697394 RepID=UPI0031F09492
MYFSSKKDIWSRLFYYGFLVFIVFIYRFGSEPFGFQLIPYDSIFGYILTGVLLGGITWIWFRTGYFVEDGKLTIRFGPIKRYINSRDIIKISNERSLITAPALSVDRLSILYGDYKVISISPKNKEEFIHLLTSENTEIKYIGGVCEKRI